MAEVRPCDVGVNPVPHHVLVLNWKFQWIFLRYVSHLCEDVLLL